MNRLLTPLLTALALSCLADASWAHGGGHRHHHRKEHKEQFWDGNCKVERKWKSNGEYKEKRRCHDRPAAYYAPAPQPVYAAPVLVAPRPPEAIVISPQIVIRP